MAGQTEAGRPGLLDGKVAVIAGGTSGIGARTAELFVAEGALVVVAGRREPEGKELATRLGPAACFIAADVTVEADVERLITEAAARFGRLDVLVNNAGMGGAPVGGIAATDLARFWDVMAVHVGGALAGMKYAAAVMSDQGSGSIVNQASIASRLAGWSGADYSAAKAALVQLTRCAAIELGASGVRVNSVSAGPIPTGIFGKGAGMDPAAADRTAAQLEPTFVEALAAHQPIRRAGTPDDVAQLVAWLASDASAFVTGQDIAVDGGISAGRPLSVALAERRQLAAAFARLT
jgi:NAD(P)-dependent dehydrogenase (short-subunit alcohol dehydrogenase family)